MCDFEQRHLVKLRTGSLITIAVKTIGHSRDRDENTRELCAAVRQKMYFFFCSKKSFFLYYNNFVFYLISLKIFYYISTSELHIALMNITHTISSYRNQPADLITCTKLKSNISFDRWR